MTDTAKTTISLRPMGLDDIPTVAEWFWTFQDIAFFDRDLPVPVNIDAVRESWRSALEFANPPRALWFVAENSNKTSVAICGLQAINYVHGDAVLAVFVTEPMRGKGLARAMAVVLADLAFDQMRLNRLSTFYRDDHSATQRILVDRIGFQKEGCKRQAWYADGIHRDVIQVGLLSQEWRDQRDQVKTDLELSGMVSIDLKRTPQQGP